MNKIQELLTTNFHCSDLASVLLHINTETWSHHAVIIYISTMTTTCIREYKEENTNMSVANIYGNNNCIYVLWFVELLYLGTLYFLHIFQKGSIVVNEANAIFGFFFFRLLLSFRNNKSQGTLTNPTCFSIFTAI